MLRPFAQAGSLAAAHAPWRTRGRCDPRGDSGYTATQKKAKTPPAGPASSLHPQAVPRNILTILGGSGWTNVDEGMQKIGSFFVPALVRRQNPAILSSAKTLDQPDQHDYHGIHSPEKAVRLVFRCAQ